MSEPRCEMCQGWKILIFNTHKKSCSVSAPFRRRSWIAGITRAQIELVCFFITSRLDSTGAQRPNKRRISRQAESMFTADYPITRWFRYSKQVREGVEEHSGSNLAAGEAGKWIGQLTPSNYFRFPEKKSNAQRTDEGKKNFVWARAWGWVWRASQLRSRGKSGFRRFISPQPAIAESIHGAREKLHRLFAHARRNGENL